MADETPTDQAAALLHELAEALQAAGNYLGALRHGAGHTESGLSEREIVDRALSQWARAQHALRELRSYLNGRNPLDS